MSNSGLRSTPSMSCSRVAQPARGVGVDDREVDLLVIGIEIHEQLEDFVEDFVDAGIGPVDLVDHDDRLASRIRAPCASTKRVCGIGPSAGVDEEQHAVGHAEDALDLAAEVGVAGRVDDVDLDAAVVNGDVLGEDRDALLALEVVRVHDAVADELIDAKAPDCRSMASTSVVLP